MQDSFMHLTNGCSCQRFLLQFEKNRINRLVEFASNNCFHIFIRKWRRVILKFIQLLNDVLRQNIGTCTGELPLLNKRWTTLSQKSPNPVPCRFSLTRMRLVRKNPLREGNQIIKT